MKLFFSILIRGFIGYFAGLFAGVFVVAPVCMAMGRAGVFFDPTNGLGTIFYCHLLFSFLGLAVGVGTSIRKWRKRP